MEPLFALGLAVVLTYLGSCWFFPYGDCPWCGSRRRRTDKRGHWRIRKRWLLHRWLHPSDPYVRLGARLIGRG